MVTAELVKELSQLAGVSGHEENISGNIINIFKKFCSSVTCDNLGNIIAIKKSKAENAPKVMIEAHMDEIGLMITNIDENGFLYFTSIFTYITP